MQSSLKQSSSLKDADFNGNASYTIETGKEGSQSTINFKMNFDTKLQTLKKDNLKMSMTSTINMLGQNINMTMYYADGYYYMNSNGTKQKMKMDIASLQKQIQSTTTAVPYTNKDKRITLPLLQGAFKGTEYF